MRTFIAGMLLGIIIGGGGFWALMQKQSGELEKSREQAVAAGQEAKRLIDAKLEVLELQAHKIQKEMAEKGRVIRNRSSVLGERVADVAVDARITTVIKTKLATDHDLSALAISVATTDGVVMLSGKVSKPELVGKAILLALETDDVREVVSSLQISRE